MSLPIEEIRNTVSLDNALCCSIGVGAVPIDAHDVVFSHFLDLRILSVP